MNDNETLNHVKILWDYHYMANSLAKADFILAMGSADDRVAIQSAYLYKLQYAPLIITSGGFGKVTKDLYNIPEGKRFAQIIEGCGVPTSSILIEDQASNSGENLLFVKRIFEDAGMNFKTGILVTKPYMKRRAYATAAKQWPDIKWQVSAPDLNFENYLNDAITFDSTVNLMVGDLQRIKIYAEKGFQIPQDIPDEVWNSFIFLKDNGFSKYVILE